MATSFIVTIFLTTYFYSVYSLNEENATYRVATVQFEPYYEKEVKPIDVMIKNANRYAEFAARAKQQEAIIVVFPEYGITSLNFEVFTNFPRNELLPLLQYIPNPEKVTWNPCLQPNKYNDTRVVEILSCASRNNSIAMLANILTKEPCDSKTDPHCPDDQRYQFNTNVIFDKEGTLIAAYHKKHLFTEFGLDSPNEAEYVIFEIESVKFASFVCFDIEYNDPAVQLVTEKGIRNLIFSTAWGSELPFLFSLQLYSSWAKGLGVNLIVSNYYGPQKGRLGTGIYTSHYGSVAETCDLTEKSKLLVADLPLDPSPIPADPNLCLETFTPDTNLTTKPDAIGNSSYKILDKTDKPSSRPSTPDNTFFYQPLRNFSAIYLDQSDKDVTLCDGGVCCRLSYSLTNNDDPATYALVAYDGIRPMYYGHYNLGLQVCGLLRCEIKGDIESCGRVPKLNSTAVFTNLTLVAQMEASEVLPSVVTTNFRLLPNDEWNFSQNKCDEDKINSKISIDRVKSLLVVGLNARLYDRDYLKPVSIHII